MMLEMLEREQYDLNSVVLYVDCDQTFSTIKALLEQQKKKREQ
jgi:hypothetical protein